MKRKKSVHFPPNPVIPIDDSSYDGEDFDTDYQQDSDRKAHHREDVDKPGYLKKHSRNPVSGVLVGDEPVQQ